MRNSKSQVVSGFANGNELFFLPKESKGKEGSLSSQREIGKFKRGRGKTKRREGKETGAGGNGLLGAVRSEGWKAGGGNPTSVQKPGGRSGFREGARVTGAGSRLVDGPWLQCFGQTDWKRRSQGPGLKA